MVTHYVVLAIPTVHGMNSHGAACNVIPGEISIVLPIKSQGRPVSPNARRNFHATDIDHVGVDNTDLEIDRLQVERVGSVAKCSAFKITLLRPGEGNQIGRGITTLYNHIENAKCRHIEQLKAERSLTAGRIMNAEVVQIEIVVSRSHQAACELKGAVCSTYIPNDGFGAASVDSDPVDSG